MRPVFTASLNSIELSGRPVSGAEDRQQGISGFDQGVFSQSSVLCIGAGGIVSNIAPAIVRKAVGRVVLLDDDLVEASNLNRQRFYAHDIRANKAVALARNLVAECIAATSISGVPLRFEEAVAEKRDLCCDVAVCGVDNNPGRVAVSRYFRNRGIPVVFSAVSRDGDHGYVFVQDRAGPCIACMFPDMVNDDRFPCPGTPAIADILQAVGALAVYAIDTLLMQRRRTWNYRKIALSDGGLSGAGMIEAREGCPICSLAVIRQQRTPRLPIQRLGSEVPASPI